MKSKLPQFHTLSLHGGPRGTFEERGESSSGGRGDLTLVFYLFQVLLLSLQLLQSQLRQGASFSPFNQESHPTFCLHCPPHS